MKCERKLGTQAEKKNNELAATHIIAGAGKQGSRSSLTKDSVSQEIFAVNANEVLHTARAEPFDTPAVRPEHVEGDNSGACLVEACKKAIEGAYLWMHPVQTERRSA